MLTDSIVDSTSVTLAPAGVGSGVEVGKNKLGNAAKNTPEKTPKKKE